MDPADRSLIMAEATNPQQHEPKRAKQSDERADLRSTPRLRPAQECRALIAWSGGQQKVAVVDLSQRGARVHLVGASDTPSRGHEIELTIEADGLVVRTRARVAWTISGASAPWQLGLQCLGPNDLATIPTLLNTSLVRIDPAVALRIPAALAVRRQILPMSIVDGVVQIACATNDPTALATAERALGRAVRAVPAEPDTLRVMLRRIYGEALSSGEAEDPVTVVNELLHAAWLRGASDLHIDSERDSVRVRLRVDGQLEELRRLPLRMQAEVVSRIKVLGGLDIAERRAAQDGRFTHEFAGREQVDMRVASLPTRHGERISLRLLALGMESLTLGRLGMAQHDLAVVEQAIERPHGLLLATGPTGSGKTTTLYAALRQLISGRNLNVIAVQDPVEYDIPGVAQVEVDNAQKVTFAKALRSILRHDPDVIMIGEIRDRETADIAIQAALTGHLVLATLHTNSAAGAMTRLHDMGIERFLSAATVRLCIAQRLVRRLCPHCRIFEPLDALHLRRLGIDDGRVLRHARPRGCVYCAGRGWRGRIGLFEMPPVNTALADRIEAGDDERSLAALVRRSGSPSLLDDALTKLNEGETTIEEIISAVGG